jgi:hypothetical protein
VGRRLISPDRAAEGQAGPVEDQRLVGPEFGLGPAAEPHDGRMGGLDASHAQHLHWEVFHLVAQAADLLTVPMRLLFTRQERTVHGVLLSAVLAGQVGRVV